MLVVNTGIFGDWFGECIGVYGGQVDMLMPEAFGDRPSLDKIKSSLEKQAATGTPHKMITITHVDTSSSVLNDVKAISAIVKEVSPTTLIAVDGVCSIGAEEFLMEEWVCNHPVLITGSN